MKTIEAIEIKAGIAKHRKKTMWEEKQKGFDVFWMVGQTVLVEFWTYKGLGSAERSDGSGSWWSSNHLLSNLLHRSSSCEHHFLFISLESQRVDKKRMGVAGGLTKSTKKWVARRRFGSRPMMTTNFGEERHQVVIKYGVSSILVLSYLVSVKQHLEKAWNKTPYLWSDWRALAPPQSSFFARPSSVRRSEAVSEADWDFLVSRFSFLIAFSSYHNLSTWDHFELQPSS